jgi:hypothetical protein
MRREVLVRLGLATATVCCGCRDKDDGEEPAGCAEPDPAESVDGPPELVAADFIPDPYEVEGRQIRLQFTEPIAPTDEVDPASFRLSVGTYYEAHGEYGPQTWYEDPMLFLCSHTDGCFGRYSEIIDLSCDPEDASAIRITLDFWHPMICSGIDFIAEHRDPPPALYIHYRPGDPAVQDLSGEALAGFGGPWFDFPLTCISYFDGFFPSLDPRISVPCIDEFAEGG